MQSRRDREKCGAFKMLVFLDFQSIVVKKGGSYATFFICIIVRK